MKVGDDHELRFVSFCEREVFRIDLSVVLSDFSVKFTAEKQEEMWYAEEKEAKFFILTLCCGNTLLESGNFKSWLPPCIE